MTDNPEAWDEKAKRKQLEAAFPHQVNFVMKAVSGIIESFTGLGFQPTAIAAALVNAAYYILDQVFTTDGVAELAQQWADIPAARFAEEQIKAGKGYKLDETQAPKAKTWIPPSNPKPKETES